MADQTAAPPAAKPAAPIKTPAAGAAPASGTPAPVTLGAGQGAGEGVAPAQPVAKPARERDPQTGKFLPADQSVDLQDKLWGEGSVEVAPEDRAISDLDGNEPRNIRLTVKRPYKTQPDPVGADPASVTLDGAASEATEPGASGVEQAGALPTEPAPPEAPEGEQPAGELDLSDPANADKLIELVIDGQPTVYKNRAHLVQAVKSLRGMYNVAERERLRGTQVAGQNYQTAQAWERVARSLGYKDGQPVAPAAPEGRSPAAGTAQGQDAAGRQAASAISDATGAPEEAIAAAVDWDVYNEIKKSKGSEVAILWANSRMIAAATSKTSQRIEEMQRPVVEREAEFALGNEYGETMLKLADWTNNDGSPSYPELSDTDAVTELGYVLMGLQKQGMSPEFLKTKRGMHTAILVWRDYRQAKGNPWRPAAATQPTPAPPSDAANQPAPNADIEAAVASVARTVTGRNAPTRPASAHDARNARIKESIMTADKNPHGDEFPWAP